LSELSQLEAAIRTAIGSEADNADKERRILRD
jgi:hypothetical protein